MIDLFGTEAAGATFSPCRTWRYTLTRRWGDGPYANFLMLNPSTADEVKLDPTVTRCFNFARAWGYGGLVVTNLFALRSTDPRGLRRVADPVGPENDRAIVEVARQAGIVIAAWGIHGSYLGRAATVLRLLRANDVLLHCLAVTSAGQPRHPLYLPATSSPQPYIGRTA